MTVRGGGIPRRPLALTPNGRMGPPLRSFATDAHDCIMVRVLGPTEYKVVALNAGFAGSLCIASPITPGATLKASASSISGYWGYRSGRLSLLNTDPVSGQGERN